MKKREVNMLSGSIVKALLTISIPIMIMNVVQSLFNVVDMAVLENFNKSGDVAVGAVGACGTLIALITGLLIGVSAGANVIVARYIGQGDEEHVEKAVGTSILLSAVGGMFLLALGVSCAEIFLKWTNCPDELLTEAVLYFRLYFAGVPILMIYNFCAAVLRSAGEARRPMIFLTLGGIIKLILNYVFVAVLDMAVAGVAFSTIISWSFSAALAVYALLKNEGVVKLKINRIRFYKQELEDILKIGVPAGLQQMLYSVANVVITATVNSFGSEAATGISIANNFDGILYQISVAASLAVMPYVSQNVGNGNIKRATQAVTRGIWITVCLGGSFGMLSAVFSAELSSIMSSNPVVIAYSQQKMIIISSTYFICGINEIMGAALRGMGRPMIATVSSLIFMCAIRFVWVYQVFPHFRNFTFLYLIWPIGWVLSIITLLFFYFPTVRKLSVTSFFRKEVEK
ncbi:MAG: MATE family efflux transporter [Lachnospiraceae bacterium]|nr:MATE family efflux transporter [Lachnospiraceae bacterium]